MAKFEVTHSVKTGGEGWPTAEELIAVLSAIPGTVKPDIRRYDSQREGSSWSLSAEWDEATQQAWKPPKPNLPGHHHGGNCRGAEVPGR